MRLVNQNTDPTKRFTRTSSFQHAADASFSFNIQIGKPGNDADLSAGTPYACFAWADLSWGIFFFPSNLSNPPILAERIRGKWYPRADMPPLPGAPYDGVSGDVQIVVENIRNSIVVTYSFSSDVSLPQPDDVATGLNVIPKEYTQGTYTYQDNTDIHWKSGKFDVFGYGTAVAFGFGMVSYTDTATWVSTAAPLLVPRTDTPIYDVWGNSNGGSVTATMLNGGSDYFVKYRLNFTSYSHTIGSRKWMRTPDVEAVRFWYAALPIAGYYTYGDSGSLLEGRIKSAIVRKPAQLDQASASGTFFFPDGFQSVTGQWRWTPCRVFQGWEFEGTEPNELINTFTGYWMEYSAQQKDPYQIEVEASFISGSVRAKKSKFSRTVNPRGGLTLNQCLDFWLQGMGVDLSRRVWDVRGDLIVLPKGRAEDPAFLPEPNGDSWEFHQRLCDMHGLELAWTDDGLYRTIGKHDYVPNPATWYADPVDPTQVLDSLRVRESIMDMWTRLILHCRVYKNERGIKEEQDDQTIIAWAVNSAAEQQPNYIAFRPIIEEKNEALELGPGSQGFLALAVYNLASDYILPRQEMTFTGDLALNVGRRHTVSIYGDNMQAYGQWVVEGIEHNTEGRNFRGASTLSCYRYL